jgi:amidase
MTSDPVHYLSLTDVSERLRRGELKPTALSEMILARIGRHEGALKSYTTLLAYRAMAKARQAEAELDRGFAQRRDHPTRLHSRANDNPAIVGT